VLFFSCVGQILTLQQEQDDDSDSLDFLPEDSPLKGKAPASKQNARKDIIERTRGVTEAQVRPESDPMFQVAENIQTGQ
jgi:hypothetical protein